MKKKGTYWIKLGAKEDRVLSRMTGRIKNSMSGFLRALIVLAAVCVEFAIIIALSFWFNRYTVYFYIVLELSSLLVTLILVNDLRSPAYKVAWISVCMVLPFAGEIMFLLWGNTSAKRKIDFKMMKIMEHGEKYKQYQKSYLDAILEMYPSSGRLNRFLESEGFPVTKHNKVKYYPMGEDVFEGIIKDLEQAKKFIFLDFFIVAEGALWDVVHAVCVNKLREGVEIKFLYDDFGAMLRTERNFAEELRREGFEVAIFNPIHRYTDKLYMNYRSHQKIVVIDGRVGYTGGFNLADEYANLIQRFGLWKDTGIRVEGESVRWMTVAFLQMWEVAREKICVNFEKYFVENKVSEECFCQFVTDGPLNNPDNPIEAMYGQMMHYATKYLYIMTPYLVIEKDMQDALITAVKSGVDVRIITPYIPDKKIVKLLTNYNYGYLLANGVRIFEYLPGFIHAKCILNEKSLVIGSINMDYRSFYLHYENGMYITDGKTVEVIKEDFDTTFEQCREVAYEDWLERPKNVKVKQAIINAFSTLF